MAIGVVMAMAIGMTMPALTVLMSTFADLDGVDTLFDLVTVLFGGAWLLGWCLGLLVLYAMVLILVAGREVLVVRPGILEVHLGFPGLALSTAYETGHMGPLQRVIPKPKSSTAWRGPHLVFEYPEIAPQRIGSGLSEQQARQLLSLIHAYGRESVSQLDRDLLNSTVRTRAMTAQAMQARPTPSQVVVADPAADALSLLALITANLLPLFGVMLLLWDLGVLMVLYWAESAVIGFYNLLKLWKIGRWLGLMTGLFFMGHFTAFMAVHFLFIYGIFVTGLDSLSGSAASLEEVAALFAALWPALLALFISHGVSFVQNFIGRKEYLGRTLRQQMIEPYDRIVLMQITIVIGGGIALLLGDTLPVLLLMVVLKIGADIHAHLKQRQAGKQRRSVTV